MRASWSWTLSLLWKTVSRIHILKTSKPWLLNSSYVANSITKIRLSHVFWTFKIQSKVSFSPRSDETPRQPPHEGEWTQISASLYTQNEILIFPRACKRCWVPFKREVFGKVLECLYFWKWMKVFLATGHWQLCLDTMQPEAPSSTICPTKLGHGRGDFHHRLSYGCIVQQNGQRNPNYVIFRWKTWVLTSVSVLLCDPVTRDCDLETVCSTAVSMSHFPFSIPLGGGCQRRERLAMSRGYLW